MKIRNRTNGFTLVETLLIIIAITLVIFVSWYVWDSNQKDKNDSNKPANTTQQTKPVEVDPTEGWKEYTNAEGKYSLRYPTTWVTARNQEGCGSTLLLASNSETVGSCQSDGMGPIMFTSGKADMNAPLKLTTEYYSDIKTNPVTINGVAGTRQSGTYTYEGPGIGPIVGSKEIQYSFETNGRIYRAVYVHQPNRPDLEKEFELIVTKTLRFN